MTKRTKKSNGLILRTAALAVACAVALVAAVLLLPQEDDPPAFSPPPHDAAAAVGEPTVPEGLGWSEMAVRSGFTVNVCGELQAQNGRVTVWFYNRPENDCRAKLRILDTDGNTLGETGLLSPGEYVEHIALASVPEADSTVTLKVMGYEQNSYYSAGSVSLETTLRVN